MSRGGGDGSAVWDGSDEYSEDICEEIEQVVRWNAPISWGSGCSRAVRTRRRLFRTDETVEPWGEYSAPASYIYESCVMYEQREFFNNPAGDPDRGGVCSAEIQTRACVDCSEATGYNWLP